MHDEPQKLLLSTSDWQYRAVKVSIASAARWRLPWRFILYTADLLRTKRARGLKCGLFV
jgi:hypothetical protein